MLGKKWKNLSSLRKKAFAVALSTAVVSSTLNIGSYVVSADSSLEGRVITAFEELPEEIAYQYLPVGAPESDINFPDRLNVTIYSEDPEEEEPAEEEESSEEEPSEEEEENPSEESGEEPSDEEGDNGEPGDSEEPTEEGGNEEPGEQPEEEPGEESGEEPSEQPGEEPSEQPAEEPAEEQPSEQPAEEPAEEQPAEQPAEEPAEQPAEEPAEEPAEQPTEQPAEEPAEQPAEQPAEGEGTEVSAITDGVINAFMPVKVYASETVRELPDGEHKVLRKVKWKLNREKSTYGSYFQAVFADDVFVYEPDISVYGLTSDVELPEIRVTIVSGEEEPSTEEREEEEKTASPALSQFSVVGGVKVSVDADAGVFPEGALIHVRRVDGESAERIEESVNSENARSFDITVTDMDGNEIQPDTSAGKVRVTFSGIDTSGEGLKVYHFDDDLSLPEELKAEVDEANKSAAVEADHFSVYTVVTEEERGIDIVGKSVKDIINELVTPYSGEYDGEAHDSVSFNDVCTEEIKKTFTFKSGTSTDFSSEIPQITDAGEYVISVRCKVDGQELEGTIRPIVSQKPITEAMVTVSDSYYMGKAIENAVVKDGDNVLDRDVDYTAAYSNNVNVGTAKVTITGKGNYKGSISRSFKIIQYSGSYKLKYDGSTTIADWYKDSVTVTADGYTITDDPEGTFAAEYILTGTTKNVSKAVYLRVSDNGVIATIAGPVNFDPNPPKGTIKVKGKTFSGLQEEKKTFAYTNAAQKITVTSDDTFNGSGVKRTDYYITNKCYTDKKDVKDAAGDEWEVYDPDPKPGLKENKLNYVYVRVTDKVGNEAYISTQGIWYDTKKPTIKSAKASEIKDTSADLTVKASDGESGVEYYYSLVKKKSEKAPKKAVDVKNSGSKTEDGEFELTGLTASTAYVAYSVVEDKAGNLSEIKETKISTKAADNKSGSDSDAAKGAAGSSSTAAAGGAGGAAGGAGGAAGAAGGSAGAGGSNVKGKTALAEKDKDNGKTEEGSKDEIIPDKIPYIEDATEGITIGRENTSGWPRIDNEVKDADAPARITVNMNGESKVPASVLNDIKDRDIAIRFVMNDDVSWTVNGLSFTDEAKDVDFRVKTNTKNIPSSLINEIADVYPHVNLTLDHEGDFGFTAIMGLNVGESNRNLHANLYYYNEGDSSLEFMSSSEVDEKGHATFDFTHASDYTVIMRGDALTEKSAAALAVRNTSGGETDDMGSSGVSNVPRKNNRLWLLIISIVSILLCVLILFMPEKRKNAYG